MQCRPNGVMLDYGLVAETGLSLNGELDVVTLEDREFSCYPDSFVELMEQVLDNG